MQLNKKKQCTNIEKRKKICRLDYMKTLFIQIKNN